MGLCSRRARQGYRRYLISVILLAVAIGVAPHAAGAQPIDPWPTGWGSDYMERNSNCTGQADPINLIFYSAGYRALSKVEDTDYLGWTHDEGSVMHVWDMFQCIPNDQRHGFNQRESDHFNCHDDGMYRYCEWYHIRLWDGFGPVDSWGYFTGAGAHLDKEHICWPVAYPQHKAVDFNDTRDDVVMNEFASHGFAVSYMNRGNTEPSPQDCSGVPTDPHSDGWVGKIHLPPPTPTMFKEPAVANLWVCTAGWPYCQGPGEGDLGLAVRVSGVTTFDWNHDDQFDGVGRYQYDVTFNHTVVDVASLDSPLLGSTGRSVSCGSSAVSGGKRFWCQSSGSASQPGPLGDPIGSAGVLATTWVTPDPSVKDRIRPAKNNYLQVAVNDENCSLQDISGNAVPGSSTNGMLPFCSDSNIKVRILESDLNLDCNVDIIDDQMIAYRYGAVYGNLLYDPWYDLQSDLPGGGLDYDIDIKDLQRVFGRNGSTCQNPIPAQPP